MAARQQTCAHPGRDSIFAVAFTPEGFALGVAQGVPVAAVQLQIHIVSERVMCNSVAYLISICLPTELQLQLVLGCNSTCIAFKSFPTCIDLHSLGVSKLRGARASHKSCEDVYRLHPSANTSSSHGKRIAGDANASRVGLFAPAALCMTGA